LITEESGKHGSADSYMAELKGARFVIMQEPSKGKTLKEGLMKQLTSGLDEIKTRALYKEPISFKPQLTLVVCANDYLNVNSQDEGTWRRIRAIPFKSKFTFDPDPNNPFEFLKDTDFAAKLHELKESFMSMLIHKYFETEGRVGDCEIVTKKSREYRNNEDLISQFIDDCIYLVPNEEIDVANPPILKQQDVLQCFKIFKEINGNGRKYNNKEIFETINKKFPACVQYVGRNNKLQWRNLAIAENED
jgi:phage/plasmid-associated DNA primase